MLWITCPNCGSRPVAEYAFGAELRGAPDWLTDPVARDIDYSWMLDNVDGIATERWFHHAGCRRWVTIRRDTRRDVVVDASTTSVSVGLDRG